VFRGDWSANEELALLDAIGKFGLGNWKDISVAVSPVEKRNVVAWWIDV
jgi:hypothetical protein